MFYSPTDPLPSFLAMSPRAERRFRPGRFRLWTDALHRVVSSTSLAESTMCRGWLRGRE